MTSPTIEVAIAFAPGPFADPGQDVDPVAEGNVVDGWRLESASKTWLLTVADGTLADHDMLRGSSTLAGHDTLMDGSTLRQHDRGGRLVATEDAGDADGALRFASDDSTVWTVDVDDTGQITTADAGGDVAAVAWLRDSGRISTLEVDDAGVAHVAEAPWIDVSGRVRARSGVEWGYGRVHELDQMTAGIGSVVLDNRDRALDPNNSASAYAPFLDALTHVRVRAWWGDVWYPVMRGYIENFTPQWTPGGEATLHAQLIDGTELIANSDAPGPYDAQNAGERVAAILDDIGWPSGLRDIDTAGTVDVQAAAADATRRGLAGIRQAEVSEDGAFFIAPDGKATFQSRSTRLGVDVETVLGTSVEGGIRFQALAPHRDVKLVRNKIVVSADGLADQTFVNEQSKDRYGPRLDNVETLLTTTGDMETLARLRGLRRSIARTRIDRVKLQGHGQGRADSLPHILGRRLGDRARLVYPFRGTAEGGDPFDAVGTVEQVRHHIGYAGDRWDCWWSFGAPVTVLRDHDRQQSGSTLGVHDVEMGGLTMGDHDEDVLHPV